MAALQKPLETETATSLATEGSSCHESCKTECAVPPDRFPAGLRVLVVDDDMACLKILDKMLRKCLYRVTTCCQATVALSMLREKKGGFDIIISDVYMPDMDGYKLLEHVGLEMDLPVIMMSADGGTSSVMRGIQHGACDYLIKPVRIEELKNVWQHVIRKKCSESKELEHSGSVEDTEQHRRANGAEYASSVNTGTDGNWNAHKKRRDLKEDEGDGELENGDPSASKKPRVVWSVELHQQFVNAVDELGLEKAVPKRILELMNVPGLTRENVASHLQKFRLYLKKLSGVSQQQGATTGSFGGPIESRDKSSSVGRADLQTWGALGLIPSQTLAALHTELLGRPTGSLILPGTNQHLLPHTSMQGLKSFPVEGGMPGVQPMLEYQSGISKLCSQPAISFEDIPSAFPSWPPNHNGPEGSTSNIGGLNTHKYHHFGQILLPPPQQQQSFVHPESRHTINLQTSYLIAASQWSNSFQHRNNPILINQSSGIGNSTIVDYSVLPSQLQNSSLGHVPDRDFKNVAVLSGCSLPEIATPPSLSSSPLLAERGTWLQEHDAVTNMDSASRLLGPASNICKIPPCNTRPAVLQEQVHWMNLGFVGKGTSIPSLFAVDDTASATDDDSLDKICK